MTDDLFAKLRKFIYQGGNAREALNRAEEEVAYWKNLAANSAPDKTSSLRTPAYPGSSPRKTRARSARESCSTFGFEIADLRNKVAA